MVSRFYTVDGIFDCTPRHRRDNKAIGRRMAGLREFVKMIKSRSESKGSTSKTLEIVLP